MTIDFLIGAVRASDLHPLVKTELDEILHRAEPVKQKKNEFCVPMTIRFNYECECGTPMMEDQPYCMECGRPVDWS